MPTLPSSVPKAKDPSFVGCQDSCNEQIIVKHTHASHIQFYHKPLVNNWYQYALRVSYRCDFGLDALPEGLGVVLVLDWEGAPHADHAVSHPQGQAACTHRREGQGVHKPPQGGKGPAAVQRRQIPAFYLE